MSEPEVIIPSGTGAEDDTPAGDVEMEGLEEGVENGEAENGYGEPTGLEDIEADVPSKTTFVDYLRSPIVELVVGTGDDATTLFAHRLLLAQSPFFKDAVAQFSSEASRHRIELPSEDLAATASFLEYLYKADYFPTLSSSQTLEHDPSIPSPDHEGIGLLRHARVYTLAQQFGLPDLAALAHKKIHLTQSNARGEIVYARYVYANTKSGDTIRKPVAAFWATRSHVLRHDAEDEFRKMCLEFPQFGFDVLSLVLDAQEKRTQRAEAASSQSGPGSTRKRARMSQG